MVRHYSFRSFTCESLFSLNSKHYLLLLYDCQLLSTYISVKFHLQLISSVVQYCTFTSISLRMITASHDEPRSINYCHLLITAWIIPVVLEKNDLKDVCIFTLDDFLMYLLQFESGSLVHLTYHGLEDYCDNSGPEDYCNFCPSRFRRLLHALALMGHSNVLPTALSRKRIFVCIPIGCIAFLLYPTELL